MQKDKTEIPLDDEMLDDVVGGILASYVNGEFCPVCSSMMQELPDHSYKCPHCGHRKK